MSPTSNSSQIGWSPIAVSLDDANWSQRRRTDTMGTNTRQRAAVDWTSLSLHHNRDRPTRSRISAPHPSPDITGGHDVSCPSQHLSFEWDGTRERMCF
jgi:hypothetical protein